MIGVIEWVKNGQATGTFSPYIIRGKGKSIMIMQDNKPIIFNDKKSARKFANELLKEPVSFYNCM